MDSHLIIAFVLLFPIVVGWWCRCCCGARIGRTVAARRKTSFVTYTDAGTGAQGGAIYDVLYLRNVGHIISVRIGTSTTTGTAAAAAAVSNPHVVVQPPADLADAVNVMLPSRPLGLPPLATMVVSGAGYTGVAYLLPDGRIFIVPGPPASPGASLVGATIVFPLIPEPTVTQ
jgi:hypothetical protein